MIIFTVATKKNVCRLFAIQMKIIFTFFQPNYPEHCVILKFVYFGLLGIVYLSLSILNLKWKYKRDDLKTLMRIN